ncbi:hypothetical protein [Archangium primigenium]|uniref:hypothetical protein n=1 Tax=[Archangium] primigenium TaxID=2792470 RepID=UPI00195C3D87|nr:hypothetical protein [Archangium primigenium]MBM7112713.1 hypothetical protein [Archangium primigenium]
MSLYAPLGCLEVAFRNSLHEGLSVLKGTSAWYDLNPAWLSSRELDAIKAAKAELVKNNRPLDPGRIVAGLNFGFWTSLVSRSYEQVIWPALLKSVFPHMTRSLRTRHRVAERMHQVRNLRNRVFHHEPIWRWRDLPQKYSELKEAIGWFEPALLRILPGAHVFDEIHSRGPASFEVDVQ